MSDDTKDDDVQTAESITPENVVSGNPVSTRKLPEAMRQVMWQKGQSGNPSGRGGLWQECQRIARENSPEAMRRLVELTQSSDERVAIMASEKVLERAWGKVKESKEEAPQAPKLDLSGMSREKVALLRDLMREAQAHQAAVTIIEGNAGD